MLERGLDGIRVSRTLRAYATASSEATASSSSTGGTAVAEAVAEAVAKGDANAIADAVANAMSKGGTNSPSLHIYARISMRIRVCIGAVCCRGCIGSSAQRSAFGCRCRSDCRRCIRRSGYHRRLPPGERHRGIGSCSCQFTRWLYLRRIDFCCRGAFRAEPYLHDVYVTLQAVASQTNAVMEGIYRVFSWADKGGDAYAVIHEEAIAMGEAIAEVFVETAVVLEVDGHGEAYGISTAEATAVAQAFAKVGFEHRIAALRQRRPFLGDG